MFAGKKLEIEKEGEVGDHKTKGREIKIKHISASGAA